MPGADRRKDSSFIIRSPCVRQQSQAVPLALPTLSASTQLPTIVVLFGYKQVARRAVPDRKARVLLSLAVNNPSGPNRRALECENEAFRHLNSFHLKRSVSLKQARPAEGLDSMGAFESIERR